MKHAVLIMAHKNKEQLIRLIKSLACPEFDIFVHPDKNWQLSDKDLSDIGGCADNIYLCSKRIHGTPYKRITKYGISFTEALHGGYFPTASLIT